MIERERKRGWSYSLSQYRFNQALTDLTWRNRRVSSKAERAGQMCKMCANKCHCQDKQEPKPHLKVLRETWWQISLRLTQVHDTWKTKLLRMFDWNWTLKAQVNMFARLKSKFIKWDFRWYDQESIYSCVCRDQRRADSRSHSFNYGNERTGYSSCYDL